MIVWLNLRTCRINPRQVKTVEREIRLQRDSPGDAIGRKSWPSPLLGHPDATFFSVKQGQCKKRSNSNNGVHLKLLSGAESNGRFWNVHKWPVLG